MAVVDGVYRATSGFSAYHTDGTRYSVQVGQVAREGHWVLANNPGAFVPLEVDYEYTEPVKRGPGRPRKDESPEAEAKDEK